ncbi:O-methyltransferase-like protein family 3 [Phyllosticta citribraziliensis]|uniref:O-methyltransferase-like protein family 3 n=1 Tax=Phyllosticta citribraziliensis TaxID=989973 RepID=A0ABR1LTC6_9PEZI
MPPPVYEPNPLWTAVDSYTTSHLHTQPSSLHESLSRALSASAAASLPSIAVSPVQGKFLMLQARLLRARHILEVGTLGGYSTIWLAHANPTVRITTVELDPHHAAVSRQNVDAAGVGNRVEIVIGTGLDVLPRLSDEVQRGERDLWDMTFIDADKQNSWNYLDLAVKMSRGGALIVVDNVVRRGRLADEEAARSDSELQGNRIMVEKLHGDERVDATVTQMVSEKSYDGMLFAVVRDDIRDFLAQ